MEGFASAKAFTWVLISSILVMPLIFGPAASRPAKIGCAWPSRNAGMTKASFKSIVVSGLKFLTSSPTARMRESLTSKS